MSLVDITPSPAEDEIMDPATKQYVDSGLVITEGRSDAKLAEFRSTIEAYTARADEREAAARDREIAAREREAIRAKALEQHMRELAVRAEERAAAAREREALGAKAFEQHMSELAARAAERDAAAREREAAIVEREAISAKAFEQRMNEIAARAAERDAAAREREAAIVERGNIRAIAFEQRMDDFMALSNERHKATLARFDRLEASISGIKRFVVGASLSTVLGVGAIYAALIQNYHAAFDSARYLATAERDMAAQRQRTEALLTAIDARLAAMPKDGGQQAPSP